MCWKILFICLFPNMLAAQAIRTQHWQFVGENIESDTTVRINSDSLYMPFIQQTYAKKQFDSLSNAWYAFDSIWQMIDRGTLSVDSAPLSHPGMAINGRLILCIKKITGKRAFKKYDIWIFSTGQTKEYNEHFGTYEIYYMKDIGVVAVVKEDYNEYEPIFRFDYFQLLRSINDKGKNLLNRSMQKQVRNRIHKKPGIII